MGKFFKWFFLGALIGAGVGIALYILGFCVEIINCACHIATCNCDGGDAIPGMWSGESFKSCMLFCTIGGWIIGSLYGAVTGYQEYSARIAAERAERDKNALQQRQKYAEELKKEIQGVLTSTYNTQKQVQQFEQEPTYSACDNQKAGWLLLKNAYHTNEELNRVIEEINANEEE